VKLSPRSISFSHFLILLHAHATAEKLFLKSANDYNYLKQSNCLKIDGVDDSKKFTVLVVMLLEIQITSPTKAVLIFYLIRYFPFVSCAGCIGYNSNI
jgi:myosin heavy subunit